MTDPTLQTGPQMRLFELTGRRVLVLGLGDSGLSMARWAASTWSVL